MEQQQGVLCELWEDRETGKNGGSMNLYPLRVGVLSVGMEDVLTMQRDIYVYSTVYTYVVRLTNHKLA